MITSRRQFLKSLGAALFVPALADLMPAAEPEETVDVNWFRAYSDNNGGPILAEARFRVNGGEWITKQIEGIEEYETCTYFPLTARIGIQTNGNWRKLGESEKITPVADGSICHTDDFGSDFGFGCIREPRDFGRIAGTEQEPHFYRFQG